MSEDVKAKITNRVLVNPETGCWLWQGSIDKQGYGWVSVDGKVRRAHRAAYRAWRGEPGTALVCHACDIPACVCPWHLYLADPQRNQTDARCKGRIPKGEDHGYAKLTEDAVRDIRQNYVKRKVPLTFFAKKYGVDMTTVHQVVQGKVWKHVSS